MKATPPDHCPECDAAWVTDAKVCDDCGYAWMNQGDHHSGPYGYSAGTPYSDTQYGSSFDEEADWGH